MSIKWVDQIDQLTDIFEEVSIFVVRLGRFAPFAKYQHRGMAIWHVAPLRFAPAFRALGVCEHIWPFNRRDIWATLLSPKRAENFVAHMAGDETSLPQCVDICESYSKHLHPVLIGPLFSRLSVFVCRELYVCSLPFSKCLSFLLSSRLSLPRGLLRSCQVKFVSFVALV